MEKLIELLNEYEKSKDFRDYEWRIEKATKERPCGTQIMGMSGEQYTGAYIDTEEMVRIVISKKYEFIKWLVDNDKIDDNKCDIINDIYNDELPSKYTRYDAILMGLAIQDNPIEFLISILK